MHHRIGLAFAIVCALLAPVVARAQSVRPTVWQGPPPPHGASAGAWPQYPQPYAHPIPPPTYAQPAYPQTPTRPAYPPVYARPTYPQSYPQYHYPQAHYRPGYAVPAYPSASGIVPASYAYAGNATYGSQYPVSYYGSSYAPQNAFVAGQTARSAETTGPSIKTTDRLHYVEIGAGAFIPTDSGNPAKLGLEANVWALHGGWVPNSGLYLALDASTGFDIGCLAPRATDGCKGHLRIHWIGVGPFFNTGTPMIAPDVQRSWDLMALAGAEVRLWKGMTAKGTVNWFLPNPWGVYAYEKESVQSTLSGGAPAPNAAGGVDVPPNPVDEVESVLGHALSHPQLNLMAMWEF